MAAEIFQASGQAAMHTMLSEALPQAVELPLSVAVFAGLAFLFAWGSNVAMLKMAGWKAITERFPMRGVNLIGVIYPKQNVTVGNVRGRSLGRGPFDIRVAEQGLGIYPRWARRRACLIPWSAIRRVTVGNVSLTVSVRYERTCDFELPVAALPAIRARVSADLFHQNASAGEAIRKALQAEGQPRWTAAIMRSAEQHARKRLPTDKRDDTD